MHEMYNLCFDSYRWSRERERERVDLCRMYVSLTGHVKVTPTY